MLSQKLMGMASAPGNIVAALGRPVHMVTYLKALLSFRLRMGQARGRTPERWVASQDVDAGRGAKKFASSVLGWTAGVCLMVAAFAQDSAGNNDSFYKARESDAGFRASVFANPMVRPVAPFCALMRPRDGRVVCYDEHRKLWRRVLAPLADAAVFAVVQMGM